MNTLTQTSAPMQFGTGSKIEDIKRVRDQFLDIQYRQVSNRQSYWENILGNIHYMEQLIGDPGENGLRSTFDNFWSSIEELKTDPTNDAAKAQIVSRAEEITNILFDLDTRMNDLQSDINEEIEINVNKFNSYFTRLTDLNSKIKSIKISGSTPNDLLDERDRILDELSDLSDLKVNYYSDGTVSLRIGDRTLLNNNTYQELKAYNIPGTNGYKNIYANNNKVVFNDGKMSALFQLRDETISKYRSYLNGVALNFADSINLIYEEGWDSTGNITGSKFFNSLSTTNVNEDSRLFRLNSYKTFADGPVNTISSDKNFYQNSLSEIDFLSSNNAEIFSMNFSENSEEYLSINNNIDLENMNNNFLYKLGLNLDYDITNDLLKLKDMDENLSDKLIIDFNNNLFRNLGFNTKEIQAFKIDNVASGSISLNLEGISKENLVLSASSLEGIRDEINNQSSIIRAFKKDNSLYIVPTDKVPDFDINNILIEDNSGLMEKLGTTKTKLETLDLSNPTMDNIFNLEETSYRTFDISSFPSTSNFEFTLNYSDGTTSSYPLTLMNTFSEDFIGKNNEFKISKENGVFKIQAINDNAFESLSNTDPFDFLVNGTEQTISKTFNSQPWKDSLIKNGTTIEINGIKVEIDFNKDTLQDLKDKINSTNTGILVDFTPHGQLFLKAGESNNFDLRNFTIKGDERFFELLGLIQNNSGSYSNNFTLISPEKRIDEISSSFVKNDKLLLSQNQNIISGLQISSVLKENPSNLSIDLGNVYDSNNDWLADTFQPIGESSTSVWDKISELKNKPLLNDGKDGFSGYLGYIITEIGIEGETANKMKLNSDALKNQIITERDRVKSVSIDEEMSNMIKYQQAFNASARVVTAVDEMIQRLVNNLGIVGR
jgi:flagellar hook-associated protein 1 FlgK